MAGTPGGPGQVVGGSELRNDFASGHLTFTAPAAALVSLATGIDDSIEVVLGRREDVYVRQLDQRVLAVRSEEFAATTDDDVYERGVTVLPDGPPAESA